LSKNEKDKINKENESTNLKEKFNLIIQKILSPFKNINKLFGFILDFFKKIFEGLKNLISKLSKKVLVIIGIIIVLLIGFFFLKPLISSKISSKETSNASSNSESGDDSKNNESSDSSENETTSNEDTSNDNSENETKNKPDLSIEDIQKNISPSVVSVSLQWVYLFNLIHIWDIITFKRNDLIFC
jgi:hypothetical protein